MLSDEDTIRTLADLCGNPKKAAAVLGIRAVKEASEAYDAGLKQGKRNGCCIGCLIPVVGVILAVYILAAVASAAEIPKEIVDEEHSTTLSSIDNGRTSSYTDGRTSSYTERLKNSGITTPEAIVAAEILDNACENSVGAGLTPTTTYKNGYGR